MTSFIASSRGRSRRRNAAAVSEQGQTRAITFTLFGRFIRAKFGTVFRIQRLSASASGLKRKSVPVGEFMKIGICAGKPIRHGSLRRRDFRRRLAPKDSDRLAGIEE